MKKHTLNLLCNLTLTAFAFTASAQDLTTRPSLTMTRHGTNMVLSWPGTEYYLQQAETLPPSLGASARRAPGADWAPMLGSSPVTVPMNGSMGFFRLCKQIAEPRTNVTQTPWAVLLCNFQDDQSAPPAPDFMSVCQKFFTRAGAGTYNAVQFFHDMSHGAVDLGGSQVFGWLTLDAKVSDLLPLTPALSPRRGGTAISTNQALRGMKARRNKMMTLAKRAARKAGIPLEKFYGVVLVFNVAVGDPQGGAWAGGVPVRGVFSDWRYVSSSGTESFGQQMGRAYGLDRSFAENLLNGKGFDKGGDKGFDKGGTILQDPWDTMGAANAFGAGPPSLGASARQAETPALPGIAASADTYSFTDETYGARGPGFNACNLRGRRWLDESRVWHATNSHAGPVPSPGAFSQTIVLRPLYRRDLPGLLAAELPPFDGPKGRARYLVEFRVKEGWDSGIPRSAVLVHRFKGAINQFLGSHSYLMSATNGQEDLIAGDEFSATAVNGSVSRVEVVALDENQRTASVRLSWMPAISKRESANRGGSSLQTTALPGPAAPQPFAQPPLPSAPGPKRPGQLPPEIVGFTPPPSATNEQIGLVNLTVQACRFDVHYQWYKDGSPIPNGTRGYVLSHSPWRRAWEKNPDDGVYSVECWNAGGTNLIGPWNVRAISAPVPGSAVAWGANEHGQVEYPVDLTNATAIAAGQFHSVALRENGTVVQWGAYPAKSDFIAVGVAPDYSDLVSVAAGREHDLGLKSDGTVVSWGQPSAVANRVPSNLTGVKAVAAGWFHNLAILKNGQVVAWGNPSDPQSANVPADLGNVTAISAQALHSLALRKEGTVAAWGSGTNGETKVPAGLSGVVAIAAGGQHNLALKADGTVVAWGCNDAGQANVPPGLNNVLSIAAGWSHSVAMKNDGTVVAWGDNSAGQTEVPSSALAVVNPKLLAAGGGHTLVGIFSPFVQYPVEVSQDLLLIYNSNSADSIAVKDYYLAHRPMVSDANVLDVSCSTEETDNLNNFTNTVIRPVLGWLRTNPTKHPNYIVLFPRVPTRFDGNADSCASVLIRNNFPGTKPVVTCINLTNVNDCLAYIRKIESFGTNHCPGRLVVSASAGGYRNTNYVFDFTPNNPYLKRHGIMAATGVTNNGAAPQAVTLAMGSDSPLTNAANVSGYLSLGRHGWAGRDFAMDGSVKFTGNSGWFVMATVESNNGLWWESTFGGYMHWLSRTAFGGTNYENTPVGAVCHVQEPGDLGTSADVYFGLWQAGKTFGICSSCSRVSRTVQAIGDPFVCR